MKLWVTPNGDRWLCNECQPEFEELINSEKWRVAFEEMDQMLRCSNCKHCDVEIPIEGNVLYIRWVSDADSSNHAPGDEDGGNRSSSQNGQNK